MLFWFFFGEFVLFSLLLLVWLDVDELGVDFVFVLSLFALVALLVLLLVYVVLGLGWLLYFFFFFLLFPDDLVVFLRVVLEFLLNLLELVAPVA